VHTVNLPATQWRVLDEAHQKRNLAESKETSISIAPSSQR
jgi:hypothetical protein